MEPVKKIILKDAIFDKDRPLRRGPFVIECIRAAHVGNGCIVDNAYKGRRYLLPEEPFITGQPFHGQICFEPMAYRLVDHGAAGFGCKNDRLHAAWRFACRKEALISA